MKRILTIQIIIILCLAAPALAQWSTPVRISEPGGIDHPQILAQGDTLHVVFMHSGSGRNIGYLRSSDAGITWSQEVELTNNNVSYADYPRILILGSDLMAIFGVDLYPSFRRYNIGYCISHDNGVTWSGPIYIFSRNWDLMGQVSATNLDSTVTVIFKANMNPGVSYFAIRSTDFGATWSDTLRLFMVDGSSVPDQAAGNGIVHYAWGGRFVFGVPYDVYYIRSTDGGLTWSENAPISQVDGYISNRPALAVDEAGNPAISWWDFKYSPYQTTGDILSRWSLDLGWNWLLENQVTQDHFADFSDISWVGDTIRIVWQDWRFEGTTIYYTSAYDGDGIWSQEQRLEDSPDWSTDPAIAASNGRVYVVWDGAIEEYGLYFTRYPAEPDAIEEGELADKCEGLRAYPNPFNSNVSIGYSIQHEEGGQLTIYSIEGRKIKTFNLRGKEGQIEWDARDAKGKQVSSGIYFVKAEAFQESYLIKVLYLK